MDRKQLNPPEHCLDHDGLRNEICLSCFNGGCTSCHPSGELPQKQLMLLTLTTNLTYSCTNHNHQLINSTADMSWVSLSLCDYMFQIVQYSHFLASLKLREDVTGP